jgi:hypothetical protein
MNIPIQPMPIANHPVHAFQIQQPTHHIDERNMPC